MNPHTATQWLQRWDTQQERYIADREARFQVVIDVVQASLSGSDGYEGFDRPRVVDLGCGPGSLADRLAARLPDAEVVGVDADPVLLALASAHPRPGVRFVRADLAEPHWPERLELPGPWDAVVSSTALHWLEPADLAAVYRQAAAHLRSGGVLVNADNMHLDNGLEALALAAREGRERRAGVQDNEDWSSWWQALRADPELAPLVGDHTADTTIVHSAENGLSVRQHTEMLLDAGFAAAGPVWQSGDDHVLVAVR